MKVAIVLLCGLVALGSCAVIDLKVRYDNYAVYKVYIDNVVQLEVAKTLSETINGYTIWRPFSGIGGNFDIMVSPLVVDAFKLLTRLNAFRTQLLIPNVQKLIDAQTRTVSTDAAFDWKSYRTLDEIYAWLDEILAAYPTKTSSFVIGKSYDGRDIRGIKISHSEHSAVFVEGGSVAHEWISVATATYLINALLTSTDSVFRYQASKADWYIVPVLNVDGYVYSHKYNRLWRKNRQPHIPTNCVGTDISRNFGYKWMENQGGSGIPCSELYAGTEAYSASESKALTVYIRSLRGTVGLFISLRAYGEHVLTPFSYSSTDRPDDYKDLLVIAESTAKGIKKKNGSVYTTGAASTVVGIASGTVLDWGTTTIPGGAASLTWVLPDTGKYGYLLPPDQIEAVGEETVTGMTNCVEETRNFWYIW